MAPAFVRIFSILVPAAMFLYCCNSHQTEQTHAAKEKGIKMELNYAKRFQVYTSGETTTIAVNFGDQSGDTITYALVSRGDPVPGQINADQVIEIPVRNLVVTSTSHVPFLNLLQASELLVGFPNTSYISSAVIRDRIERGLVEDVGGATGLNFESLVALQPELVVSYLAGVDRSELDQLQQTGIPYVLNFDFMEETPLGRAEWIKFMGLLLGKYELADSVFTEIENKYLDLLHTTRDLTKKPTVFSGILYGDTWFAPGAKSFAAKLIEDAGGNYSWKDLNASGSVELSLEAVLDRNANTDFWIGTGDYSSKISLAKADPRYSHFKAFQVDQVYNFHRRIGATGGFEYFELAGARPDLVLSDLIKIFHPDILPHYEPYFYQKLD